MKSSFTKEKFIIKANLIHNNKYNYSLTNFKFNKDKIIIICPIHGEFLQTINGHINSKRGCKKCGHDLGNLKRSLTNQNFIEKANLIHDNKYDYSLVNYKNNQTKIKIICKKHNIFEQTPSNHLKGMGCKECSINSWTKEKFLDEALKLHGDYYDYTKSIIGPVREKIKIECRKHGVFNQFIKNHLEGKGCPKCRRSKGEVQIVEWFKSNNINFIEQKIFPDCKYKLPLRFDFYLKEYNLLIEYNGIQHFKSNNFFKLNNLEYRQKLDQIKKDYAIKNNYNFLEIKFDEDINKKLNEQFKRKN